MVRLARADGRPSPLLFVLLFALGVMLVSIYRQNAENRRLLQHLVVTNRKALAAISQQPAGRGAGSAAAAAAGAAAGDEPAATAKPAVKRDVKPVPQLTSRGEIPALLEREGLKTGAELGVLFGEFASHALRHWPKAEKYYLVDLWGVQENYRDLADTDADTQEKRFQKAKDNLKQWEDKTVFLRMYTTEAAKKIPDNSLDYVYVDARHDYCGVMEDLVAYWPKLKSGGIFAGHDYIDAHAPQLKASGQDWSVCMDGSVNMGAVKGAVDEFAEKHGLTVVATTNDGDWPSWLARKP